ncbi:MAG: hypothetical protein HUU20_04475 [Pirellulales bacterium]|nr:hypothetical protein [Pirellulales bacterium]
MNPSEEHLPPLDDGILDLLVDGELSEADRRDLLASLDRRPDGWRRCALAFLEAQCWKREFGEVCREAETQGLPRALPAREPPPSPREGAQQRDTRRRRPFDLGRLGPAVAVAATFLIALGIGVQIRRPSSSDAEAGREAAGIGRLGVGPQQAGVVQPTRARDPFQVVTLAGSGGPDQNVRLPAREGARWDEGRQGEPLDATARDVFDALRRAGREVRHSRQYIPMPLEDGRQLIVPVDQVDVQSPTYQ